MKFGDQCQHQYVNQVNENYHYYFLRTYFISISNEDKVFSVNHLCSAEICPAFRDDKYPGSYQPTISYDQAPLDDGYPIGTVATFTCVDNDEYYLWEYSRNISTCHLYNTSGRVGWTGLDPYCARSNIINTCYRDLTCTFSNVFHTYNFRTAITKEYYNFINPKKYP